MWQSRTAFSPSTTVTSDRGSSKTTARDAATNRILSRSRRPRGRTPWPRPLLHDGVPAHNMSPNVRPPGERRRRLSGRRNGEPLDMGQRTGRCRFYLLNAVYSHVEPSKSGILQFLSSKRSALCVALSFGSLSAFNVRQGKEPFLHHLSPSSRQSLGNEGINSKVDVCELAKHYTNSSGKVV